MRQSIRVPWALLLLASFILVGLILRLTDLTDPPFDFHPTRQLGSAIIARGMYYQISPAVSEVDRAAAVALWREAPVYEAPILESLVAATYLLMGSERLWIARVYSSILWLSGVLALALIGRRLGLRQGAVAAEAFYVILPFGVLASRSFQPDPWMAASLLFAAWGLLAWSTDPSRRRALVAGLICGAAILIKPVAALPMAGAVVGLVIGGPGMRSPQRWPQLLLILGLTVLPSLAYFLLIPSRSTGFLEFWVGSFTELWTRPDFYVRWVQELNGVLGFTVLLLGLVGAILFPAGAPRSIVVGLWAGYGIFGFLFPYQIMTHDYYHLMVVPIAALSLMPLAQMLWDRIRGEKMVWQSAALAVLAFAVAVRAWQSRTDLLAEDYRGEAAGWRAIGEAMPRDGKILALTHAYGFPLMYYGWTSVSLWPSSADLALMDLAGHGPGTVDQTFRERTAGFRYFLVTDFQELARQSGLEELLRSHYKVEFEGDGFLLFDLAAPQG